MAFETGTLSDVWNTEGLQGIMELTQVPFGNAKENADKARARSCCDVRWSYSPCLCGRRSRASTEWTSARCVRVGGAGGGGVTTRAGAVSVADGERYGSTDVRRSDAFCARVFQGNEYEACAIGHYPNSTQACSL